jgi:hypothetical protein
MIPKEEHLTFFLSYAKSLSFLFPKKKMGESLFFH